MAHRSGAILQLNNLTISGVASSTGNSGGLRVYGSTSLISVNGVDLAGNSNGAVEIGNSRFEST